MTTFTIDSDYAIIAFGTRQASRQAQAAGALPFTSKKELAKLTADWPISRLVTTWNSLVGAVPFDDLKPVKKFTDRKTAVARIWQAIQRLAPPADRGAHVAPETHPAVKETTKRKRAHTGGRGAKKAKAGAKAAVKARDGSKAAIILGLIAKGATLPELMATAGWQAHSVRSFLSTTAKKQGIKIQSTRNKSGERFYRIAR